MPAATPSAWRRPRSRAARTNRKKSGPGDSRAAKWVLATRTNAANMKAPRNAKASSLCSAAGAVLEKTQVLALRRNCPGVTPVKRRKVVEKCAWS